MAFQRGEDTWEAQLGAMMTAEFQAVVVKFIIAYAEASKKASKGARRR